MPAQQGQPEPSVAGTPAHTISADITRQYVTVPPIEGGFAVPVQPDEPGQPANPAIAPHYDDQPPAPGYLPGPLASAVMHVGLGPGWEVEHFPLEPTGQPGPDHPQPRMTEYTIRVSQPGLRVLVVVSQFDTSEEAQPCKS